MESNFEFFYWRHLKGELSAEEQAQLSKLLANSPENRAAATEIEAIWEKTAAAPPLESEDLTAAFARVQAKIQQAETPMQLAHSQVSTFVSAKFWLRVAAAGTILLVSLWGMRQFSGKASDAVTEKMVFSTAAPNVVRQISLSDGTQVWLRGGSQLEYPNTFLQKTRRVCLRGEAFFVVAHRPEQPFRVEISDGSQVEVLGTEFDIRAFDEENNTSVTVKSGKVRFSNTKNQEKVVLTARQKGIFDRNTGSIQAANAETLNGLAWQTGGLVFEKTPLSQVLRDFENFYQVKIQLENEVLLGCTFNSPVKINLPAEEALSGLAAAFSMRLEKTKTGGFVLKGGVCQ